jgi:hypothetical protein
MRLLRRYAPRNDTGCHPERSEGSPSISELPYLSSVPTLI